MIERLGSGGMAAVYLAHDERLDRHVAVKRMHAGRGDDMDARRFEREAKIGASLSHPNLVSIFDTLQDDESVLLVMEYVEGETLADLLARGGVEPRRAVEIVRAVAEALDHAHASGIVHRDIKPGNVLLGGDGAVKLADLGIAKAVERTEITGTGTVLGTPAYMAPEQLEGGEARTRRSTSMRSRRWPSRCSPAGKARRGRTAVEIAHQVVNEPPPDAHEANPAVPPAAADAIRAGMARDPADRPRSAVALAERLERAFGRRARGGTRPLTTRDGAARGRVALIPDDRPFARGARQRRGWIPAAALLAVALAAVRSDRLAAAADDERAPTPRRTAAKEPAEERRGGSRPPAPRRAEEPARPSETPEPPPARRRPAAEGAGARAEAQRLQLEGYTALQAGDYKTAIELSTQSIEAFPPGTTCRTTCIRVCALQPRQGAAAGRAAPTRRSRSSRRGCRSRTRPRRSSTSSTCARDAGE